MTSRQRLPIQCMDKEGAGVRPLTPQPQLGLHPEKPQCEPKMEPENMHDFPAEITHTVHGNQLHLNREPESAPRCQPQARGGAWAAAQAMGWQRAPEAEAEQPPHQVAIHTLPCIRRILNTGALLIHALYG